VAKFIHFDFPPLLQHYRPPRKAATQTRADLIMHINSVFSILGQMGVGPKKGFAISGADEKWSDFLEDLTFLLSCSIIGRHEKPPLKLADLTVHRVNSRGSGRHVEKQPNQ